MEKETVTLIDKLCVNDYSLMLGGVNLLHIRVKSC